MSPRRGRPVWAPRLPLPPAKIRKVKAEGWFWIPIRKSRTKRPTEPRKIQRQWMQAHTDLLRTHSTSVYHKICYLNSHDTAPQR